MERNKILCIFVLQNHITMTHTINLEVKGLVYENGTTEILVTTPRQWSQKMRNKKYKNTIITKSELASIHIKIKTK